MNYRLVIFDMDGTILFTLKDIVDGLNHALQKNGLPSVETEDVRRFIGNGIRREVEQSVPAGTSAEVVESVFADFNTYYAEHCSDNTHPYEGIIDLLKKLRSEGVLTAVVSNKGDYAVQQLNEQYFEGLLDAGVGEKEGIARKPAPDTVNEVLRQLHTDRHDAVYVGDSEVDLQTAENAGMDCIAVEWGYRSREFLEEQGAKTIVSSVNELYNFL